MSTDTAPPPGTPCYFCKTADATRSLSERMHHAESREEADIAVPSCDRCKSRLGFLNGLTSLTTLLLAGAGAVGGWFASRYLLEGTNPSRGRGKAVGLIVGAGAFLGGVVAIVLNAILKKALGASFGMRCLDPGDFPAVRELTGRGYSRGKLPAQK